VEIFAKQVGRGIHRFEMIAPGERVLIGVSGGRDSLALCLALAERLRWLPREVHYECQGLCIDWREYPAKPEELERLVGFLDSLGIPCRVIQAGIYPLTYEKAFNCYICSRNRKRILFREAERLGIRTIALGHHRDDVIETTLMNLFFRGEFATMMPVQQFFAGRMRIIRPMCEVDERAVLRLMRVVELPVFESDCPLHRENQRRLFKDIIRQASRVNRQVRNNLYRAPWHLNREYLPSAAGDLRPPAGDLRPPGCTLPGLCTTVEPNEARRPE
jgi:tRNA 2-thiocytidine biosynthesis protein TtcA